MSVHRLTELPELPARGRLIVSEGVISPTRAAIQASSTDSRPDEGLVLWLGRNIEDTSLVLACAAPRTTHDWGRVHVGEAAVGTVASAARAHGLGHTGPTLRTQPVTREGRFLVRWLRTGRSHATPRAGVRTTAEVCTTPTA